MTIDYDRANGIRNYMMSEGPVGHWTVTDQTGPGPVICLRVEIADPTGDGQHDGFRVASELGFFGPLGMTEPDEWIGGTQVCRYRARPSSRKGPLIVGVWTRFVLPQPIRGAWLGVSVVWADPKFRAYYFGDNPEAGSTDGGPTSGEALVPTAGSAKRRKGPMFHADPVRPILTRSA